VDGEEEFVPDNHRDVLKIQFYAWVKEAITPKIS
jgi:hypothetical protein